MVDPQTRFGLVSDIDDTVMVTALPRPLLAAWHTFVVNEHARSTTPGMPVLYERLTSQHPGAPVIYLSTGAWNVAPTLTRFLSRNLYPAGALLLTDWGPTADRWFRSGQEHKRSALERLATEFPDIKWLLIGDDGQHDEAIYGNFLQRAPGQRRAPSASGSSPPARPCWPAAACGTAPPASGSTVPWLYASDGAGLADELERIGLLDSGGRSSRRSWPDRVGPAEADHRQRPGGLGQEHPGVPAGPADRLSPAVPGRDQGRHGRQPPRLRADDQRPAHHCVPTRSSSPPWSCCCAPRSRWWPRPPSRIRCGARGLEPLAPLADFRVIRCRGRLRRRPAAGCRTGCASEPSRAAHADAEHLTSAPAFEPLSLAVPTLDVDTSAALRPRPRGDHRFLPPLSA